MLVTVNQPEHALYLHDLFALHKMADANQDEREATFKFIEEVHNCPAVRDISCLQRY